MNASDFYKESLIEIVEIKRVMKNINNALHILLGIMMVVTIIYLGSEMGINTLSKV